MNAGRQSGPLPLSDYARFFYTVEGNTTFYRIPDEKPDAPVLDTVYHALAFVRLVLHPDQRGNEAYLAEWTRRTADCLRAGDDVYMMIHCPNNLHCPAFARQFHERLRREPGMARLAALPPWPLPRQRELL